VFLDLDEEQARQRGGWGGELYERAEMQRRVRSLFLGLSRGGKSEDGDVVEGMNAGDEEDIEVVKAGASVEEVSEAIWEVVKGVEGRRRVVE
jgi:dTMP kinase